MLSCQPLLFQREDCLIHSFVIVVLLVLPWKNDRWFSYWSWLLQIVDCNSYWYFWLHFSFIWFQSISMLRFMHFQHHPYILWLCLGGISCHSFRNKQIGPPLLLYLPLMITPILLSWWWVWQMYLDTLIPCKLQIPCMISYLPLTCGIYLFLLPWFYQKLPLVLVLTTKDCLVLHSSTRLFWMLHLLDSFVSETWKVYSND